MGYICGPGCQIEQMDPFTQTHSGINIPNWTKTTNGRVTLTFGPHWLCRSECMRHIDVQHTGPMESLAGPDELVVPRGVGGKSRTATARSRKPSARHVVNATTRCRSTNKKNKKCSGTGLFHANVRTGNRKKNKKVWMLARV